MKVLDPERVYASFVEVYNSGNLEDRNIITQFLMPAGGSFPITPSQYHIEEKHYGQRRLS